MRYGEALVKIETINSHLIMHLLLEEYLSECNIMSHPIKSRDVSTCIHTFCFGFILKVLNVQLQIWHLFLLKEKIPASKNSEVLYFKSSCMFASQYMRLVAKIMAPARFPFNSQPYQEPKSTACMTTVNIVINY